MPFKLTAEIITAAIEGFEIQKASIDAKIAELRAMPPGGSTENARRLHAPGPKRRMFSAAARKRMKEAQQRRWAKVRGESDSEASISQPKPKCKLSAAARAKLVANLKKARAAKAAKAAATA